MTRQTLLVLTDDDGGETRLPISGLDRLAYDRLLAGHPPRPREKSLWNEATFPPALIAACTGQSLAETELLWERGEVDEAEEILEACVRLSAPGSWEWAKRRLLRDPRLRLELRFCGKAGVSHSHFLGGPRLFTDDDQDLALASLDLDLDRCPGECGVPTAAMNDPDAASVEQLTCIHCEQLEIARKSIPPEERDRVHVFVVPAPPED